MGQRISNDHAGMLQSITLCMGAAFFVTSGFILFQSSQDVEQRFTAAVVGLLSFLVCYYFAGFYQVSFDNDFIYIARFRSMAKVALEKVESVRPDVFPIRFFFRNVYVVKVAYLENGRKRKIRFFSKGARGFIGTIDSIPLLDSLRQQIKAKK